MSAAQDPSEDDLAAAWRAVKRPDWPDLQTLRQCAQRFGVVRAAALGRAHDRTHRPCNVNAPAPAVRPPVPPGPPTHHNTPRHAPTFDRKRAAAGERPDDG